MSYILEALKKFEQKREKIDPSKSLTFLGTPAPEPKRRPLWPYPIIAALLLNAGVMIWWIGPWRSDKKEIPPKPSAVQQPRPTVPKEAEPKELKGAEALKGVQQPRDLPISPKPVGKKEVREDSVEKKVIYFIDGKSEGCTDIQLTENFIYCTKTGGGSITNRNKIDLEKTFSEKIR